MHFSGSGYTVSPDRIWKVREEAIYQEEGKEFLLAFLLGVCFQPGYESTVMTVQAAQKERMTQMAHADGEDTGELFVEMRDEKGRKLLLQEGASLPVEKRVRFEISGENLPEGTVSLQLLATEADGQIRRSRIFLLENV